MMKKHMVPLTPKGQTVVHQGKGSQMTGMPNRGAINSLAAGPGGINNYAKATPMAQPQAPAGPMPPMGPPGMGV